MTTPLQTTGTILNEPPYWIEKMYYGMWEVGYYDQRFREWHEIGCVRTLKMARAVIKKHMENHV